MKVEQKFEITVGEGSAMMLQFILSEAEARQLRDDLAKYLTPRIS